MCEMCKVKGSSPAVKSRYMRISSSSRMHYLFLWQEGRHVSGADFWQIVRWKDKSKVDFKYTAMLSIQSHPIPHRINSTSNAIHPIHPSSLFISTHLCSTWNKQGDHFGLCSCTGVQQKWIEKLGADESGRCGNHEWMLGHILFWIAGLGFLDLRY